MHGITRYKIYYPIFDAIFIKQMAKLHLDFIDTIIHRVRDIVLIHCTAFVPDSFMKF